MRKEHIPKVDEADIGQRLKHKITEKLKMEMRSYQHKESSLRLRVWRRGLFKILDGAARKLVKLPGFRRPFIKKIGFKIYWAFVGLKG